MKFKVLNSEGMWEEITEKDMIIHVTASPAGCDMIPKWS